MIPDNNWLFEADNNNKSNYYYVQDVFWKHIYV